MSLLALTAAATTAAIQPMTLDLAVTEFEVLSLTRESNRFEIEFSVTVSNVGDVSYDPNGISPDGFDNANLQTYLSDDPASLRFASGGYRLDGLPVIEPGESFTEVRFSNTAHLPDPMDFGEFPWLVIVLGNTGEEPERMFNNRAAVLIPTPGTGALACVGLATAVVRRRR